MRLNVKLSPDLERQLIDTSMVPLAEADVHIMIIQTTSAMSAPLPQPSRNPPSVLGPASSAMRASSSAPQSGKLVIPTWATPNRSHPTAAVETALHSRKPGVAGPYGYQPDFMHAHTATNQLSHAPNRANSSLALLPPSASPDGQVTKAGLPISRQDSTSTLAKPSGLVKQGSLLGPGLPSISTGSPRQTSPSSGRARRPSFLALSGLHSLPEHDPYLGPPKPKNSPRRISSSFLTGNLSTPPPGSCGSRKGSFEDSTAHSASMPMISLTAQINILDASLTEPEVIDQTGPADPANLLVELSRSSTSGSLEAHASAAAAAVAPVLVTALFLCGDLPMQHFLIFLAFLCHHFHRTLYSVPVSSVLLCHTQMYRGYSTAETCKNWTHAFCFCKNSRHC